MKTIFFVCSSLNFELETLTLGNAKSPDCFDNLGQGFFCFKTFQNDKNLSPPYVFDTLFVNSSTGNLKSMKRLKIGEEH